MTERVLVASIGARRVGRLTDANGVWSFQYAEEWLASEGRFELAPGLPLQAEPIVDGGSKRPVQWYFDNLLPEEDARELIATDVKVDAADAFGLLERFGAETAGSLTLLKEGQGEAPKGELPLSLEELAKRVAALPKVPLGATAPKKMSMAGAHHKLGVIVRKDDLFEPTGSGASTHLLKPEEINPAYPHTVINEYLTMRLAGECGLIVPPVQRRYIPAPIYLVSRFDRSDRGGGIERLHSIDACQLLNLDREFKYSASSIDALKRIAGACTSKATTRLRLFNWVVFNILVGNSDAHLKNLSFLVERDRITLSPHYDLLSVGVYETKAYSAEAHWPQVALPWKLGSRTCFGDVNREALTGAADELGINEQTASRVLDRMVERIASAAEAVSKDIEEQNKRLLEGNKELRSTIEGEQRLIRAVIHIVIKDMSTRLEAMGKSAPKPTHTPS